jgi:hypothetical protein
VNVSKTVSVDVNATRLSIKCFTSVVKGAAVGSRAAIVF